MQRLTHHGIPAVLVLLSLAGCADQPSPTDPLAAAAPLASASAGVGVKFLVAFSDRRAPADFEARVSERGGTVDDVLGGPGIAIVSGLTSEAAAELSATYGIDAVAADMVIAPGAPEEETTASGPWSSIDRSEGKLATNVAERELLPDGASNYGSQWNMRIIRAETAWHAGEFGSRTVRVYLLDTGVDYTRIDLRGHVDPARSISLVPDDAAGELALAKAKHVAPYMDFHSHGTAVASTIVSNGIDLAGVTTKTNIVAVKVLDRTRVGLFTTFIKGIDYAANDGADIIHLSLAYPGFSTVKNPQNAAAMIAMVDRATTYAHARGAVIMVAGGNAAANLDDPSWWRFCNAKYVLCVSATAANDQPASYTNYGVNTVTVAGPGGDTLTTTGDPRSNMKVLLDCSSFSLVTTGNPAPCGAGEPRWESLGTTFGAAATSGLAALIISKIGHGQPDLVRDILVRSADDLGPPGRDKFYGAGRINVARALELLGEKKDH